ncbi:unnamed protein product, partial [Prorocentrum cordatum]
RRHQSRTVWPRLAAAAGAGRRLAGGRRKLAPDHRRQDTAAAKARPPMNPRYTARLMAPAVSLFWVAGTASRATTVLQLPPRAPADTKGTHTTEKGRPREPRLGPQGLLHEQAPGGHAAQLQQHVERQVQPQAPRVRHGVEGAAAEEVREQLGEDDLLPEPMSACASLSARGVRDMFCATAAHWHARMASAKAREGSGESPAEAPAPQDRCSMSSPWCS